MRTDSKVETQHYVPKLLLRRFVLDSEVDKKQHQVWCFDKHNSRVFRSNITGVFAENAFYDLATSEGPVSLEAELTEVEKQAAPVIERIVLRQSLSKLSEGDRRIIATFVAVQFSRTKAIHDYIASLSRNIVEQLVSRGFTSEHLPGLREQTDSEIKRLWLTQLADSPQTFASHFSRKHWHLVLAKEQEPFFLGDNPVVLENPFYNAPYGTLGIASPGICIYVPLSSTICLSMIDPDEVKRVRGLRDEMIKKQKKLTKFLKQQKRLDTYNSEVDAALQNMETERKKVDAAMMPFLQGKSSPADSQVIMRINSLQVMYAYRWIACSKDHFDLPRRMISDDERFRRQFRGD